MKNQLKNLLLQLQHEVGQPDFLSYLCDNYRRIMHFQQVHFCCLHPDGEMTIESSSGHLDTDRYLKYSKEDIWRPENTNNNNYD